MGFFTKKAQGVVLIDIGSASVGGAYLCVRENQPPLLCYTARIPVSIREKETVTEAMLRALDTLCKQLITEGAPALYREAGDAHIEMVLATVAAPWQETIVRTVTLEERYKFVFTRHLMERAVRANAPITGRTITDTSIISTKLNGYETDNPWNKHTDRADLTVLTSTIDTDVVASITKTLRASFHSHHLEIAAFAPIAYSVVANLYPLQKDFVVIDVSGTATDVLLVRHGVIASVRSLSLGVAHLSPPEPRSMDTLSTRMTKHATDARELAEGRWLLELRRVLAESATENPLPSTIFLLADEDSRTYLKELIDTSTLRSLWLSSDPLALIPLAPEHTSSVVRVRGLAEGDVFLSMLALFYQDRLSTKKVAG